MCVCVCVCATTERFAQHIQQGRTDQRRTDKNTQRTGQAAVRLCQVRKQDGDGHCYHHVQQLQARRQFHLGARVYAQKRFGKRTITERARLALDKQHASVADDDERRVAVRLDPAVQE